MALTYVTTVTLPDLVSGDTFLGHKFELITALGAPISLVGADIELKTTRDGRSLGLGTGITISDAINGMFEIDEQIINWPAGVYNFRLRVTYDDGKKRAYIQGTWTIVSYP